MNALAIAEIANTLEDAPSPQDRDKVCVPICFDTGTPCLSPKQETFLRERYSTQLEDPWIGHWIPSWRMEG